MNPTRTASVNGYQFAVTRVEREDPCLSELPHAGKYTAFWEARWVGRTWFLARGNPDAPRQTVVWYPNGKMWSGYGKSIGDALAESCRDGWKYIA